MTTPSYTEGIISQMPTLKLLVKVNSFIEFASLRFSKADIPLYSYDQNTANNGFTKVIEIINN